MKIKGKIASFLTALLVSLSVLPVCTTTVFAEQTVINIDLSKDIDANAELSSDSAKVSIKSLEKLTLKTTGSESVTIDGTAFTTYVTGSNNASIAGKTTKGGVPETGAATVIAAKADDVVFSAMVGNTGTKKLDLIDGDGTIVRQEALAKDGTVSFNLTNGHTYYFYGVGTKIKIYAMKVTVGKANLDWTTVKAPILGTPVNNGDGTVTVSYTASIGDLGGQKLAVDMYDKTGKSIDQQVGKTNSEDGKQTVTFTPTVSGDYTFKGVLSRTGTDKTGNAFPDKTSEAVELKGFILPLAQPSINKIVSKGSGSAEVNFNGVDEAESYDVTAVNKADAADTVTVNTKTSPATLTVKNCGAAYNFTVTAKRGTDKNTSAAVEATVEDKFEPTWLYADFGNNATTDRKNAGYTENADGSVTVWNLSNSGKLIPLASDGLSFYYTPVPSNQNFTFSADVTVNSWTYTNAQEGFGLMAADRVGKDGESVDNFYNNSYMDSVTKVEYNFQNGAITDDATAAKCTMKLGIGSQEKIGLTPENINDNPYTKYMKSTMTPLETSCGAKAEDPNQYQSAYNLIGNEIGGKAPVSADTLLTTFHMTIQKNNTGYFVSYTNAAGETVTNKYYDTEALNQFDKDNVYDGVFAARTCNVTASNIKLTLTDPKNDAAPEVHPIKYITPSYQILSAGTSNSENYNLQFLLNWNGHAVIKDQNGKVVSETDVQKGETLNVPTTLTVGFNKFTATITPDANYAPEAYQALASYDAQTIEKTVTFNKFDGDYIYVGPAGTSSNVGTKDNPVDVYTAVKYAQPGQKIILLGGTYNLTDTITVPRGTDGTAEKLITMMADPDATERPVFNFGQNCEGLVIAGNYWYFQGFDVTGTQNGKDGIRLSGSYDTVDGVNAYGNGNTGLQISRFAGTDLTKYQWPHDNLVLNCTSHDNADAGYEDADGFAAKLTCGENNVFDGCISYNNADDGWDLFAKPETGSIGAVTIKNCVAFGNGYGKDGTDEGNGNGFKLGGSSLSGKHILENCVSFDNKSKGIDSNSCPDIIVKNCTTYNNGLPNIALYTNDAKNTDFSATGVVSYRNVAVTTMDKLDLKGNQDYSKVFNDTNYFWGATAPANESNGSVLDDWFASVDTKMDYKTHVFSSIPVTRNSDGTINMNGLLVLTDKGVEALGKNDDGSYRSGALISGTASPKQTVSGNATRGLVFKTPTTNGSDRSAMNTPFTNSTPSTGDKTNSLGYLLLMISAMACAFVAFRRLKENG